MSDIQHKCQLVISTPCPVIPNGEGGSKLAPVTMQWHRARMRLNVPYGYNAAELACDGFEIGEARTKVVGRCREVGADWLLFIDYDVLMPPMGFKQLMYRTVTHPDYDIFAGVYCVKEDPTIPIIYRVWGEGPCWDWKIGDVLAPVVGVPMGFTLLRLSLFDRLPNTPEKPWFKTHDLSQGNPLDNTTDGMDIRGTVTEDLWFCKRAVEEAGCKILVDTAVQCGHINNATGRIYSLPEDCPPVLRSGISLPRGSNDIALHLPKLRELARQCDVVVEFGVRDGHSTKAIIEAHPKRLVSYDIEPCPAVEHLQTNGTAFEFIVADCENVDIPECDMLLEDAKHTAGHVQAILDRHSHKVRKWLVFHDTKTYGERGEDGGLGIRKPIDQFLRDRPWKIEYESDSDNGLLVLRREAPA